MEKRTNLILTGGHAVSTATAVIEVLKVKFPQKKLHWIGAKSLIEGKYVPNPAANIMSDIGVSFIPLTTGRLQKKFTRWTIPSLFKIPIGIFQSFQILIKLKPELILSFGGFVSIPISLAAWVLRIPFFIHEQTMAVGRANKITSIFAKKIFISRPESAKYFPKNKTILVGNPVRKSFTNIKHKSKPGNPITIYITGGSSGAQRINSTVEESLFDLLKKYKIIHQTGQLDYEKFKHLKNQFPNDLRNRYEVFDFINGKEIASVFNKADIIISRSGANTVSEIMIARRPAILIPIPWTAFDEQTKNAQKAKEAGIAVILEEDKLTRDNLLGEIENLVRNWQKFVKNANYSLAELDSTAAQNLVNGLYD